MAVYFSLFIPQYSLIARPLFDLLKDGAPWIWHDPCKCAFSLLKYTLATAPVRGHPMKGVGYRLYTDASDIALAGTLQQIQPIEVRDLKGTRAYKKLKLAYDHGEPVPETVKKLVTDQDDRPPKTQWAPSFEDSTVHVERVITYWSRMCKGPETHYLATEREALAAKEALVRFTPFIEGERLLLVTDHAALQWARTFENYNRRLAAWGLVFAAFPEMTIVHRPGLAHSNMDPLSRLA
jgi:hypothetical protein